MFKNEDKKYPSRGVPDVVEDFSYRTGSNGRTVSKATRQCFWEKRIIRTLPRGSRRTLFLDNCSGHSGTESLLSAAEAINTQK